MNVITILSGGMDSTTLGYYMRAQGHMQRLVTFDYGQRHRREIDSAKMIAARLQDPHQIVDLTALSPFLKGSALTDGVDVPHGHYAADTMKLTIVPNRNAIMLAVAYAIAVVHHADAVVYGAHAGDHFIYPDCRPPFVRAVALAFQLGNDSDIDILAPFIHYSKGDIAALGHKLQVPFELTWTCYEGADAPCSRCGACTERIEAMAFAGLSDALYQTQCEETT